MVSMGEGAKSQVTGQIQALGSNLLMVIPGRAGDGGSLGSGTALTDKVLPTIAACPAVKKVAPEAGIQAKVSFGPNSTTTNVVGTTEAYPEVRNLTLANGVFFSADEVRRAGKVAVVGADVAAALFPGQDPLGRQIKVDRTKFTVIGVLATKGQAGMMSNDDVVYLPLTTAQRRLLGNGNHQLRMIYVEAVEADLMDRAAAEVDTALMAELKDENAFSVRNQADLIATAQSMTGTLTLLLGGIAGISMLVGGIGIMNIMLVSVTERIREIGIRKALGAQEDKILAQFILEAATLSLLGGVIGILLGAAGSAGLSRVFGWKTVISPAAVALSFGLSLAIGLFFGVYPARKASRLDPIVALRHV